MIQTYIQRARSIVSPRMTSRAFVPWRHSAHLLLLLTLIVVYTYTLPRWQDWNQNSRFDLTVALVEQGTVRIDDYVDNTGDYALVDGHYYSDKAPGLSLIAVPVYAGTQMLEPLGLGMVSQRLAESPGFADTLRPDGAGLNEERVDFAIALFLATLVCVSIPAALSMVLIALIVERIAGCRTAGMVTALTVGLATPFFTYSQAFYGHVPAAAAIVGALALLVLREPGDLSDRRMIAIGALLGLAVIIEYPVALMGIPIAIWTVMHGRLRAIALGVAGAAPALLTLVVYDLVAFGTPLPVGYAHSELWQAQHQEGFMSLTFPKWSAIWGLSGSPFRGLLFFAPVLLLALPGLWLATRDMRQRIPLLVAVSGFAALFIFASSSAMWWGGFAVGPRYLVPAVPLLAIPFGATVAWINSRRLPVRAAGLGLVAITGGISVLLVWSTTFARQGYPPDHIRRPVQDYVLPAFQEGDVARNMGMLVNLNGMLSLIPLAIVLASGVVWIALRLQRETSLSS